MAKNYGYLRGSKDESDTNNQKQHIQNHEQFKGSDIEFFEETQKRVKRSEERGLFALVAKLRKDDNLIVVDLTRIGGNAFDIMSTINEVIKRGAKLIVLNPYKVIGDDVNSQMYAAAYAIYSALEYDIISSRIIAGQERAKREGKTIGKPKGSRKEIDKAKVEKYIGLGINQYAALGKLMGVNRLTMKRFCIENNIKVKA